MAEIKEFMDKTGFTRVWQNMKAKMAMKDLSNVDDSVFSAKASQSGAGGIPVVTTAGTGEAYTATVPNVTELTKGMKITIITHTASTTTAPTLNVNGLGAVSIRRRISNISTTVQTGYANSWLASGKPFTLEYDGTYWIVVNQTKPAAVDLYGQTPVTGGGTGANNAADARTNLEITPENIGAAKRVVWSGIAVNTSAWAASGSYYAATVSVSGMLSTDNPHSVDIERSDDLDADAICEEAFSLVKRITTANGKITLYAMKVPESNFTIWMEGTR